MEFTVPESSDSKGGWVFETGQYGATAWDDVLSSISKCPGDFDQAAITNEMVGNCMRASSGNPFSNGFVSWAIAGEGIDLDRCQLERGETYYLNFFLTDSLPGDPVENMEWVCSSPTLPNPSACGRAMAVSTNRDACQSSFDCQENHVCENGACKPILHPNSWTRETKPLATQPQQQITTWEQLFGQAFPKGNARDTRVGIDKYASISFNSGTLGTSGQLGFSDLGGNVVGVGMRPAIVSVSELPGDFRSQFGQYENCFKTGVGTQNPSFLWTRDPADTNFKCLLEPNKDYYLNIAYVSTATQEGLVSDFDWECTSFPTEYCGHRIHPIHSQ